MSERSELFLFPDFVWKLREPEGLRLAGAFFCILFLARQEKDVAAGLPPACSNYRNTYKTSNSKKFRVRVKIRFAIFDC
ncbi:MAG: hypothetical protein C4516_02035 [Oxalobacter sp.]|nr:MAG: hypothetical protein C4516_02035 [Oxalobacter sp.]